jgi:uncharacterized protein (TIGR03435 family)
MFTRLAASGLLVWACCAARAQTAESPAFEAAVIKPSAPPTGGRMFMRMTGGPGHGDPAQITYVNVTLKMVLTTAYGVKQYQISGPPWLDTERFDITAKIAPGATEAQFKLMLQNLLAERFGMKLHHETKDLPVFALVVGKNGPKMTESKPDPERDAILKGLADGGPPPAPGRGGRGGGNFGTRIMFNGGRMHLEANYQTMGNLCDMLSNQLGLPVEDHTGLTAHYDLALDFMPDMRVVAVPPGMPMPMPPPGGGDGGGGGAAGASESSGPTLESAVQEQLGLKLERRKGPADFLVIDHMEKTATEN